MIRGKAFPATTLKSIFLSLYIAGLFSSLCLPAQQEKRAFRQAVELYDSGNFLIAMSNLQKFVETYPKSDLVQKAKLYIASCHKREGNVEEATKIYIYLIENSGDRAIVSEAMLSLARTGTKEASKYIETKLNSEDGFMRELCAESLAVTGNPGIAKKMFKALEKETIPSIQEKILSSISKINKDTVTVNALKGMFLKGSENLKISIVKFFSTLKNNTAAAFLKEQIAASSEKIKPYVLWALAKIDPYTYGTRIEGRITCKAGKWWIVDSVLKTRTQVVLPDMTGIIPGYELKEFENKEVTLFGAECDSKIIYTDIYNRK